MSDEPAARPTIAFLPGRHKRVAAGHPWAYSNEIAMDAAAKALPPGSLVTLSTANGEPLGSAMFNARTLVSARILDRDPAQRIDEGWLAARLAAALRLRECLFDAPYYRLIHAEADGIPGTILDRFGGVLVCEINTAGMARLEGELMAACATVLRPQATVLRNDSTARALEGLAEEQRIVGAVSSPLEIAENGGRFMIDPVGGQKTGWFFDQRDNRRFMARLAPGKSVLDLFCFAGGFAIQAALVGAREVLGIDRSEPALALAWASAELNGVGERCRFERGEIFETLERLAGTDQRFDIVIADPPAFVKSRKDLGAGLRGYRKLTRLSAAVVPPGGFLFIASCSHNVEIADFAEAVRRGLADAGRSGRILMSAGAAPDHPVHPFLPESAYLKAQVLALD